MEVNFNILELIEAVAKKMTTQTSFFKKSYPKSYDEKFREWDFFRNIPEFNPIYKDTILLHLEVAVHSDIHHFPYNLLKEKAPNQTVKEWEYQKHLYQNPTNATWERAKDKTKIIGNPQNFSITGWDDMQREYFYEDYPAYSSLESYFFDIVRDKKIDFPNQALVVRPKEIPMKLVNDELVPDQSVEIEPIAVIYEERQIIKFKEDVFCLILTDEKSLVNIGDKIVEEGLVFEFYDKNAIYKAMQFGNKSDMIFNIFEWYCHDWGKLPCQKLKGKPIQKNNEILYASHFAKAIPDLNDVIRLHSNLMMSTYTIAFPRIIELVDKCRFERNGNRCNGGQIFDAETKSNVDCPSCKGTGKTSNRDVTGVYEVDAEQGFSGNDYTLPLNPPVQFVSPNAEILKYLMELIDMKRKHAFKFLIDKNEKETATGKLMNREEDHSFIINFSSELFDLFDFAIKAIGFMRFQNAFVEPHVNEPASFSFRTNQEITEEIGKAKEDNLTQPYMKALHLESVNTRFNADPNVQQEVKFTQTIDRLWDASKTEVIALVSSKGATRLEQVIHDSITSIIAMLEQQFGVNEFWQKSFDEKQKLVVEKAKEIESSLAPSVNLSDRILQETDDEDVSASLQQVEAQAKLRGSVGGVEGIVKIQESVSKGITEREAGIALLIEIYGFSNDVATKLLGDPKPIEDIAKTEGVNVSANV